MKHAYIYKEYLAKIAYAFNTGDLSEVDSIFSPKYIDHQNDDQRSPNENYDGPEEFKMIVSGARKSLPNLKVTIEDYSQAKDKIKARLRWHSADDSKTIERETAEILKIEDNLITEHWGTETWSKTRSKSSTSLQQK